MVWIFVFLLSLTLTCKFYKLYDWYINEYEHYPSLLNKLLYLLHNVTSNVLILFMTGFSHIFWCIKKDHYYFQKKVDIAGSTWVKVSTWMRNWYWEEFKVQHLLIDVLYNMFIYKLCYKFLIIVQHFIF